jgi:hypothetical protein
MNPNNTLRALAALSALTVAATASAQVIYSGGSYTQNFSSLSTSTNVAQTWTNGTTIAGWHATSSLAGAFTQYTPQWQTGISAGVLYHARNTEETNRSFLGGRVTSGTENITIGLQIANTTGTTLDAFSLSFIASQFYKTGVAQQLQVSFSTDATSLTTGTWTTISALTYTAPYTTGNATVSSAEEIASRQTMSISSQSLVWNDQADLWIRWTSFRDLSGSYTGAAGVLAINDVTFSAIPEPSSFAGLAGLGALGFAALRRRRRS